MTPKQTEEAESVPPDRVMRSVPFHYGWVILASGALGSFMTTPGQTYGVSPFFDPVAHDLGLSRGAVATAYTLGTLAGVLPAGTVETSSLVPLLQGADRGPRDTICQVYKDVQRMACDGPWKLIRYYRSRERPQVGSDGIQLFHLERDPWETRDLSGEPAHAGHVERLAARLEAWQRMVDDPLAEVPVVPAPPLARHALRLAG